MSFYRAMFAAIAAVAIASPVFADDTTTTATPDTTPTAAVQTDTSANANTMQTSDASATTNAADTKIDLNKATAKDLMKVKGINASKARAIVSYRKKHGEFKAVSDITKVKGFTKMKADSITGIQDQLSIN